MSCRRYHILYYLRHTTWTKIPCPWVRSANETYPKRHKSGTGSLHSGQLQWSSSICSCPTCSIPDSFSRRYENALSCDVYLSPRHGTMVPVKLLLKERQYFLVLGEYLYRFKDQNVLTPKGLLITVATTHAPIISNDHVDNGDSAQCMIFYQRVAILFSSIEETQYFAVESQEGALIWVNNLRQILQDTITQHMGHSKTFRIPQNGSLLMHWQKC